MDRRALGGLALTLALVGVLAGSRLLNPLTVDGAAGAEPPPPPPVVGTCLAGSVTSSWDATGTLRPADTAYVSCAQPHRGEVFLVVDPGPPQSSPETVFDLCRGPEMSSYLGVRPAGRDWQPEINVRTTASGPDRRQADTGQYWVACVVVDDLGAPLTSPLGGAAAAHTVPPQLGVCFDGSVADLGVRSPVGCDGPHTGEVFASRDVEASTARADLMPSCQALVDADTGRLISGREPSVIIETVVADGNVRVSDGDTPADATGTARCVVRSADDRRLTASLRQLDDAPLPWAD
ncbi:MAG: septum formation family protein [Nakamurella sp.]